MIILCLLLLSSREYLSDNAGITYSFSEYALWQTLFLPMTEKRVQPVSAHTPSRAARSILAQWRGVDLTNQEKARTDHARHTADLMPAVMKKLGMERRQSEAEISKVWFLSLIQI